MSPEEIELQSKPRDKRAFNAYRHGLAGHVLVIEPNEDQAYQRHCQGFHQALTPVGAVEADLAQAIADDRWRLKRAVAMEANIFAEDLNNKSGPVLSQNEVVDDAFSTARVWHERNKELALLTVYENRIQRRVEKNLALLRQMQQDRRAALERVARESEILGESYDFPPESLPPQLVHSAAEIRRFAHHRRRLAEARKLPRRAA